MLPRPPAPRLAGAPNRQARMQNQARSSYASPTCTSSQSRTAARSDPSTMRFPIRKSPCTRTVADGWRPVGGQPAKHPLEGGGGVVHGVEPLAPLDELVLAVEAGILDPACRPGGWRPAPARTGAANRARPAVPVGSSSRRWMRRTMVSPLISLQMKNGLPSAAGESSAIRTWGTGAPAAAAAAWARASSSMLACTSSGGPVRRISDRRRPPVTASNAQVVLLAPPVSARRFSIAVAGAQGRR